MSNGDPGDLARRIREQARAPRPPRPKRFYTDVAVIEQPDGFAVALDRRPLRTPGRAGLTLPSRRLAEAVAAEWAAQGEHIDPQGMPLTKLANTAIDRVAGHERRVADDIVAYAGSDLMCYRAEAPEGLVARQAAAWDPVLTWAARRLGSPLVCVTGVMHEQQPAAALEAFARDLRHRDPFRLAALHHITSLTGSAVLALAVLEGAVSADTAWEAAHIDEHWQIEQWGRDAEAEAARAARRCDFDAAVRLLALVE